MNRFYMVVAVFMIVISAYSQAPEDDQSIDDGAKTSGKYGNLIDNEKTAEVGFDALNVGLGANEAREKLKGFDPTRDLDPKKLTGAAMEEAKKWALQYTQAKGAFNKFMEETLGKVNDVITNVSNRVDMWRTTYPTLKRYAKAFTRLADDTKELFTGWSISDFLDIDRKRDRRLHANFTEFGYLFSSFSRFLKTFNSDDELKYASSFVPLYDNRFLYADELASRATLDMEIINEYRGVPRRSIEFCSANIYSLNEIESMSKAPSKDDNTTTIEQSTYNHIAGELSNSGQSFEDSRELSAFIEQERAKVKIQQLQIDQMQAAVELRYVNLIKRDLDCISQQDEMIKQSLQVMVLGKRLFNSVKSQPSLTPPDKS